MKKSEIQKLNKKTPADLNKDLGLAREELRSLRFELTAGKVKNIVKARGVKRKIARILTFLKIKELKDEADGKGK